MQPFRMQPNSAQFKDFFALFELPVAFDIDTTALDSKYRSLQKKYHPDQLGTSQPNQQSTDSEAEAFSAVINHGYQILSSPDSRATYLLELQNQADSLDNSIADLDFLDDAMTLRMELDEAIDSKDLTILQALKPQIATRLTSQAERFHQAYIQKDWQTASDATQKLKFLVKLNADVLASFDDVANSTNNNDDDLYV